MDYEQNFLDLGDEIPPVPVIPIEFNFLLYRRAGDLLYLSGHGPTWGDDFNRFSGRLGDDIDLKKGVLSARLCGLNLLQTCRNTLGSLNNINSIIEVIGYVNSTSTFYDQSKVLNGCSNLFYSIFGDSGKHTRSVIGVSSLPFNFSVEIRMIAQIK